MQVMPFWVNAIGAAEHNLFHLRTNLRYGCTILRHYLDIEQGNLFRALGRYNGSLGQRGVSRPRPARLEQLAAPFHAHRGVHVRGSRLPAHSLSITP